MADGERQAEGGAVPYRPLRREDLARIDLPINHFSSGLGEVKSSSHFSGNLASSPSLVHLFINSFIMLFVRFFVHSLFVCSFHLLFILLITFDLDMI